MRLRHTLTTIAIAAGLTTIAPLTAAAARPGPTPPSDAPARATTTAAGVCDLSAPTRVAISRPSLDLPTRITGDCTATGSASYWILTHPSQGDVLDIGFESGATTYPWEVRSTDPIGVQSFKPNGAWDPTDQPLTQNTLTTTVKLATGAWISSSRADDVVTLRGTSLLYSVSDNVFFKRSASGVFQYRDLGTTTWNNLKAVTTNTAGEVSMAYRYTPTREYRFALYSTPISWDVASAITTR